MVAKGERSIEAFEKADVIKEAEIRNADDAVLQKVVSHIYGGGLW